MVNSNFYSPSYLQGHLMEIRYRLAYTIFSFLLCCTLAYSHSTQIIFLMVKPICGRGPESFLPLHFIYTDVSEAFYATLESALTVGTVLTFPYASYQSWCFIVPSLYARESALYGKRFAWCTAYGAMVLIVCIWQAMPTFYNFLHLFSVQEAALEVRLEARIAPYLSWVFTTILFTLMASTLPLFIYAFLSKKGVALSFSIKSRKITIYFLILGAACLSPGDLLSQLMFTVFLCSALECVLWAALYKDRRKGSPPYAGSKKHFGAAWAAAHLVELANAVDSKSALSWSYRFKSGSE